MKKVLLTAIALLALVLVLPVLTVVLVVAASQANAECDPVGIAAGGEVKPQLMAISLVPGVAPLTSDQADNAIAIADQARALGVPRFGLQIALATAIQESTLRNLEGGDADSAGLFQQRPSAGWGTQEQITRPRLAAAAFFGRAEHTQNPGLLDTEGWQNLSLTEAAARVQNPRADLRGEYAKWEEVAGDLTDLLGPDLVAETGPSCPPPGGCTDADADPYNLGQVTPQLRALVNTLAPKFDIATVGGYRESATDPHGHPAGLAADFMVPLNGAGKRQGAALAAYARSNAAALGVDYIIWWQRIWSVDRASEGWRVMEDRGSATQNHLDHVHINVDPTAQVQACEVVYPVPAAHIDSDRGNWGASGANWTNWHTGTDFSAPCGTPVYAAHGGTVEIVTDEPWAGPRLVKVTTGPKELTTWYAHMGDVSVARGQRVDAGTRIGSIGTEGNSTGCHLHFEVHLENGPIYGNDNVNPTTWLAENAVT